MSFPFDSQQGLIIVHAELWGPSGSAVIRLALDTGATGTLVNNGFWLPSATIQPWHPIASK